MLNHKNASNPPITQAVNAARSIWSCENAMMVYDANIEAKTPPESPSMPSMTPEAYRARETTTKRGMMSQPSSSGAPYGMLTAVIASLSQNHHPMNDESTTTIAMR